MVADERRRIECVVLSRRRSGRPAGARRTPSVAITGRVRDHACGRTNFAPQRFAESASPTPRSSPASRRPGTGRPRLSRRHAAALEPVLERELLLERNAQRERHLTASAEKRLTRIGFDLHDGPVQEVLALGAEVDAPARRGLSLRARQPPGSRARPDRRPRRPPRRPRPAPARDRSFPRVAKHRLPAHSPRSLHREIDAFGERSGIAAYDRGQRRPRVAQRSAADRAVSARSRKSLSNVREHSGATSRRCSTRRASQHRRMCRVKDNGHGFEVNRAARARRRAGTGSASSAWASGCGCSGARSTSTAAAAGQPPCASRCRAGSRSTA